MLKKPKLIKKNAAVSSIKDALSNLSAEFVEKRKQNLMMQSALQFTDEWVARRQMEKASARQMFANLFIKSDPQSL